MVVDGRQIDVGFGRDIAQGSRVETVLSKELFRGIQDPGLGVRRLAIIRMIESYALNQCDRQEETFAFEIVTMN